MRSVAVQSEALVLQKLPDREKHHVARLLSPQLGLVTAFFRQSRKKPIIPNLFDQIDLLSERATGSDGIVFAKSTVKMRGFPEIGRNFEAFENACHFARMLIDHASHLESHGFVYSLTLRSLRAWADTRFPHAVLLKALYLFAREEGFAVRESWLASLSPHFRICAETVLHTPTAQLDIPQGTLRQLSGSMHSWLEREFQFLHDPNPYEPSAT